MKRVLHILEIVFYIVFAAAFIGLLFFFLGIQPMLGNANQMNIWICICIVCGGMLMMAIYNLSLRFITRREKAALCFAIFCIGQSVRFFFMPGSIGWQLFPGLPEFLVIIGLRQIPYAISLVGLILFVYTVFGEGRSAKIKYALIAMSASVSLSITLLGLDNTIWRAILGLPVVAVYATVCIAVIVKSHEYRKNRLSVLYLFGFIMFIVSGFFTATAYTAAPYIAVAFNFVFAVIHSVLLSDRLVKTEAALYESIQKAEMLADKLKRERSIRKADTVISFGPVTLDVMSQQAYLDGEKIMLSPKEFALLHFFITNERKTVNAAALYEKIWGQPMNNDDKAVKSTVSRLRIKLEGSGYSITNKRGEGYCFEPE